MKMFVCIYYWFPYPSQSTFRSPSKRCYITQKINSAGKALTPETPAFPCAFHLKPDYVQEDILET